MDERKRLAPGLLDQIRMHVDGLPPSIRHMGNELTAELLRRFAGVPNNRAARRRMQREVDSWVNRKLRTSFIRLKEDGNMEIVPEDFPPELRDYLPELVDHLNERWADADTSESVLRRMSEDIQAWIDAKLKAIAEGGIE